jgi:hypothetical protein
MSTNIEKTSLKVFEEFKSMPIEDMARKVQLNKDKFLAHAIRELILFSETDDSDPNTPKLSDITKLRPAETKTTESIEI